MTKSKFQVIPTGDYTKNFNSLDQLPRRLQNDKNFQKFICLYGAPNSLIPLVKKHILDTDKEVATQYLLANLYNIQEYKAGNYVYDKEFVKDIQEYSSITIHKKLGSKVKDITFSPRTGINKDKIGVIKLSGNSEENSNIWLIYSKALTILQNYQNPSKANIVTHNNIKESLISIINLINQEDLLVELFCDYLKIIKSVDQEVLNSIYKQDFFKSSIVVSQNFTEFFINNSNNKEEVKYFLDITEKLINQAKANYSSIEEIDKLVDLKKLEANHHWNKGIFLVTTHELFSAVQHFEEYYKYNPDRAAVRELYALYHKTGQKQKAQELYSKHKDFLPSVDKITNLKEKGEYTLLESIKDFIYEEKYNVIINNLQYAISSENTEQVKYYKSLIKHEIIDLKNSFKSIPEIFQVRTNLLLDESNNPENIQKLIKKISDDNIKSELLYEISILYSTPSNCSTALKYIELALTYTPNNSIYLIQKHLLEIFSNITQKTLSNSHQNTFETSASGSDEEIVTTPKPPKVKIKKTTEDKGVLSYTEAIDSQDPKIIQEYFQYAKQQLLEKSLTNCNTSAGWLINDMTIIKFSQTINVFPNLYAAIDPKLLLNDSDNTHWENILGKGFTSRKQGELGIKYLQNKIYEAKDGGDERLLSSKTYTNDNGSKLMLFDERLNHKGVEAYLKNTTYQELQCPNYYDPSESNLIGAESFSTE